MTAFTAKAGHLMAGSKTPSVASSEIKQRVADMDWMTVGRSLSECGNAVLSNVLKPDECQALAALYPIDALYRSRVVMSRHGFGRGEYKYFNYPLPAIIENLRAMTYTYLAPIANEWNEMMHIDVRYPDKHMDFIQRCHNAGQTRSTPLILKYGADDYNCLHQDLYGEHVFPIQIAILLSQPGKDFSGGEFVMIEQSAAQSPRADVVPLEQGDAVVFTVNNRPVRAKRGNRRATMRHGVSRVLTGQRYTIGIIFHDAR